MILEFPEELKPALRKDWLKITQEEIETTTPEFEFLEAYNLMQILRDFRRFEFGRVQFRPAKETIEILKETEANLTVKQYPKIHQCLDIVIDDKIISLIPYNDVLSAVIDTGEEIHYFNFFPGRTLEQGLEVFVERLEFFAEDDPNPFGVAEVVPVFHMTYTLRAALNAGLLLSAWGYNRRVIDPNKVYRRRQKKGQKKRKDLFPTTTELVLKNEIKLRGLGKSSGLFSHSKEHVKSPHFRRGHFRRVRIGPGRVESKINFIPPVIVNKQLLTGAKKPNVVYSIWKSS